MVKNPEWGVDGMTQWRPEPIKPEQGDTIIKIHRVNTYTKYIILKLY